MANEETRLLEEVDAALAAASDLQAKLGQVARLMVPFLADWCLVDLVELDGALHRVAIVHDDPAKLALFREFQRLYPTRPGMPYGAANVVRTGAAEMAEIGDEILAASARDPKNFAMLQQLGFRSYMCVPLRAGTATLGAITFTAGESGRRYGPEDLALAEEIARRAAAAVASARRAAGAA
jgi:GAF domain-containing protein